MELKKSEASALSRLFSAAVLRDFSKEARSSQFARLLRYTRLSENMPYGATVGTTLDEAFNLLSKSKFRDDYVYRSAITDKILLGRHNLNTATLLNEVRAGSCKADVVVLNSGVLEIAAKDVGVITLSERYTFQTVRIPQSHPERVDPTMILDILRLDEATEILSRLGQEIPNVPNTKIRSELRRIFAKLEPMVVHDEMVKTLKTSRSQAGLASFVNSIPNSFRAASIAANPTPKNRVRIKEAVDTPLIEALAWI